MLWFSLEVPRQGASNEYPQHMFLWRYKKNTNTFLLGKKKKKKKKQTKKMLSGVMAPYLLKTFMDCHKTLVKCLCP